MTYYQEGGKPSKNLKRTWSKRRANDQLHDIQFTDEGVTFQVGHDANKHAVKVSLGYRDISRLFGEMCLVMHQMSQLTKEEE